MAKPNRQNTNTTTTSPAAVSEDSTVETTSTVETPETVEEAEQTTAEEPVVNSLAEEEPVAAPVAPAIQTADASRFLIQRADAILETFIRKNNLVTGTSVSAANLADAARDFGRGISQILSKDDRKAVVAAIRHILNQMETYAKEEKKKTNGRTMFDMRHILRHLDQSSQIQKSELNRIENILLLFSETYESETRIENAKKFDSKKVSDSAPNAAAGANLRAVYNL